MPKHLLSASQAFDLRQALHVATLDALLASRRWAPGELIFRGGTSLHLTHGSPRYSEDLDFLVNASLKLDAIGNAVLARLEALAWMPLGSRVTLKKAKDVRNPHAFVVSITGDNVIGVVRVKVELWQTAAVAMQQLKVVVAPVRLAGGLAAGMQTFVPTADVREIYADKVFALVARPYLKPRDVFDLHWLGAGRSALPCTAADMRVRLLTYPNEKPLAWLAKASGRRALLLQSVPAVAKDLARWLPSTWPSDNSAAQAMVDASVVALDQGVMAMQEIIQ